MSLHVLDLILWMFGIRGHIPQDGDFGPDRNEPTFAASIHTMVRALAIVVVSIALLSLALWTAVWFAIRVL